MKILLDTHVLLWADTAVARLSAIARELLSDSSNDAILSVASVWEIAIKHRAGRLPIPGDPRTYITSRISVLGLSELPIEAPHALRAGELPPIHSDPFDRMLVAQAMVEGIPVLTNDPHIARYDVEVIW